MDGWEETETNGKEDLIELTDFSLAYILNDRTSELYQLFQAIEQVCQ